MSLHLFCCVCPPSFPSFKDTAKGGGLAQAYLLTSVLSHMVMASTVPASLMPSLIQQKTNPEKTLQI